MATMDPARRDALCAQVIEAASVAFGRQLRCGILKGSALKGDFIPHYSDFDVHLFVDPAAMQAVDVPRLDRALAFQAAIGRADPRAYAVNACQVYFIACGRYPEGWVKPIPGTYQVVYGEPPPGFAEVDPADYLRSAHAGLAELPGWANTLISRMVDKPDSGLSPLVRLAGTTLKPAPYCAATLLTGEPFQVWRQRLAEILAMVEPVCSPSGRLSRFFEGVQVWTSVEQDAGLARRLFGLAIEAMEEMAAWHASQPQG